MAWTRCTSKSPGGDPPRPAEIWTRNSTPVLPTPPKKHQKATKNTADAQDCSLLSYNNHSWPRTLLPVLTHQWPWGPASLHRAHQARPSSPQHILSKQKDTSRKHHHLTWSKPSSTEQHSIPHEGYRPCTTSTSCSFALQPPPQKYLPRVLCPPQVSQSKTHKS